MYEDRRVCRPLLFVDLTTWSLGFLGRRETHCNHRESEVNSIE